MADTTKNDLTYRSWQNMKDRCLNIKNKAYKNYGGRGISVYDGWISNYSNFLADMGPKPKGYSIERIDNNGDYTPNNCKWATDIEQCNNRRSNRFITIENKTQTLEQWIRESNIKSSTVRQRIYVYGWSIERALGISVG